MVALGAYFFVCLVLLEHVARWQVVAVYRRVGSCISVVLSCKLLLPKHLYGRF